MDTVIGETISDEVFSVTTEHLQDVLGTKKILKILFVNPPDVDEQIFDFGIAKRGRANNYPTYGLGVLAANMQKHGYDTEICNLNHEVLKSVYKASSGEGFDYVKIWQRILDKRIESFQPDLIAATCTFSVTHPSFKKVCDHIKVKNSDTPLLIGGVHVSHDIEGILNDVSSADFAIMYEAEVALKIFLDVANGKADIGDLVQFAFKRKDEIHMIAARAIPTSDEMDVIPAYDQMDITDHAKYGSIGSWFGLLDPGINVATVQSNRGCRAACTFCNVRTFHGKGVRQRSVGSVVDELEKLNGVYGIKHVVWLDDDLLKNEKRAVELFNEIIKRNIKMTWDATNGVIAHSLRNVEVVEAAEKSGCIGLNIGIESGNPEILKEIRKPGTVDVFLKAAEVLHQFPKINSRALLIIGFPNETLRMMFDTIKLAEDMNLDWNNLAILQPWKNTPIYDKMVEDGLLGDQEGTLKTDDNKTAPYQLGTYSRQRAIERGLIEQSHFGEKEGRLSGFLDRVDLSNMDEVPDNKCLDDIWFYMNVRLNFARLLRESRPEKIQQQHKFLTHVSTKTAPDNALIMYFLGYLEKVKSGAITPELKARIRDSLNQSPYWQDRFSSFNLDIDEFENETFPSRLLSGGMPLKMEGRHQDLFRFPTDAIQ